VARPCRQPGGIEMSEHRIAAIKVKVVLASALIVFVLAVAK
jgi:hypothetical protein